ncbi:reverse transcriptase domain-containing protein [Tanacetum coccineum]
MADNRTMAQMLQAPIEGYEDAIVVPPINANNFELKQPLINIVQSNKFTGRQDPHNHLRFFNKVTSTFRHPEVPNTSVKLLLFPFSLDDEARDWLDKEPLGSFSHGDLVSKFINQYFPPSKTTYYRNEIITFYQKPNEAFNEAWERFKGLIRQYALDFAAGGNFLDKMPQEGLAIIESKSKVRYSRSRANDSRVSTDAPLFNSSPSNNSFDMQQIAASLEDKMTIKMNQMMNQMKALVVTTPAPVKAVEEVCVTCGSNHHFNLCPLTRGGNDFPVFHDNIQQFQQTTYNTLCFQVIDDVNKSAIIPSEDPYEEAARQLLEQAPRSPEYVPDPIELEDHVQLYIPGWHGIMRLSAQLRHEATEPLYLHPFYLHVVDPLRTPPLLPIPAPSTSCRADIPEADTPPRKRLLLILLTGCEIAPPLLPIPLPAPSTSHRADIPEADTPPQKRLEEDYDRLRVGQQEGHLPAVRVEIEVLRRERLAYEQEGMETRQALARSEAHCRALEARVTVLETEVRHHEWQRQAADDLAVQHIMRTQALEAGARVDTLEDTGSSS